MSKPVTLEDVIAILDRPTTEYSGGTSGRAELPWGVLPEQYLKFAKSDQKMGSTRGRVNALSNAKRALHCQVDSILLCTGFWEHVTKRRWDFHTKLDLLRDMHVAAPSILSRINRHRNEIEHKYVAPPIERELSDFLEVVELFLAGTRRLATTKYDEIDFEFTFRRRRASFAVRLKGELKSEVSVSGESSPLLIDTYDRFRKLQTAVFRTLHSDRAHVSF